MVRLLWGDERESFTDPSHYIRALLPVRNLSLHGTGAARGAGLGTPA
jgi:hypothetical protein